MFSLILTSPQFEVSLRFTTLLEPSDTWVYGKNREMPERRNEHELTTNLCVVQHQVFIITFF